MSYPLPQHQAWRRRIAHKSGNPFALSRGRSRARVGRAEEQADGGGRRQQLVHQFQPLLSGIHVQRDHPGDVAARPIQAGDESGFDRAASTER
jgi:hypothetical protein